MENERIFRNILVPVDGSIPSLIAEELAAFIGNKFNSHITVLHVVSHELMNAQFQRYLAGKEKPIPISTATGQFPRAVEVPEPASVSSPQEVADEITDWYHEKGDQIIADAVALFREEGITANSKIVEEASPADTILREAKAGRYDLIAIGSSGEEEREPHLGSVAKNVSSHAGIPVLVAREKSKISKILVPYDGSKSSEKALEHAAVLAKKAGAEMTILYVQEPEVIKMQSEVTKRIGDNILSNAADKVKEIELTQKLESGDPAKVILKTAKSGDYDIIILGSKGHSRIRRFLMGSVSDHVIHYADRSVLVVK